MDHVFISYDHSDSDFAIILQKQLEDNGFEVWIDHANLQVGRDWRHSIDYALQTCQAVVVIISPKSSKSVYVTYEWAYALGCKKNIIPLLYRQTPLHMRLSSLQYLDFTHRTLRPWSDLLHRLKDMRE